MTFGSLPGVNNGRRGVRVKAYGACHGLTTSDHAPVYASLNVAIRGLEDANADADASDDPGDPGGSGLTWEGRLRTTPERVRRGRSTGASGGAPTRLRAAAPPAAATVAVNSLRVVARGFQKGFRKGGGSKGGTTNTTAAETPARGERTPRSDKAKSDKADDKGDGSSETDSSAAGSDVDAAAAALRRLLAVVPTSTSSSSSNSPPPPLSLPVTVHVSCEGGVELVAPEAPADRAAGASVVRVVGESRRLSDDEYDDRYDDRYDDEEYDDEEYDDEEYDDDEEDGSTKKTRRRGAELEMSWADGATPSMALAPRRAIADANPRGTSDSPPRRSRLGTRRQPPRGSKSESVGSERASEEASDEASEEASEDLASRVEALTMSPVTPVTPVTQSGTSVRPSPWSRVSRVNALGACHALVTICVDGIVVGTGAVSLREAARIVADTIGAGDSPRDGCVGRSGAVRFSVPLTRCGRCFGKVEGTVSIAVPAAQ